MEISGQSALVTGAGSGLGAATARRLARDGARVAVLDRNETAAEAVAAEIGGIALAADVTDETAIAAAIARAQEVNGPLRIVVHCAGIGTAARIVGRSGPMPLADFDKVVRVNLIGSFNVLRLAAAAMSTTEPLDHGERGVVVMTASVAAFEGQIGQAAYAASKGGIAALTLPAARELASFGIRVATIAPGLFLTPLLAELPAEVQQGLASAIPFPKRLGGADEYAALAAHIVANPYLNGEVIRLDGALRMAPK